MFKPGQDVKVFLTEKHTLHADEITDEHNAHAAKFVAYHLTNADWADVDLEEDHAGGMKRLSVPVSVLRAVALILAAIFLAGGQARAQFIGFTGLQTVSALLANNATCTGSAQNFPVQNLGQISHQASATSTASSFTMEIDGTDATGATYRISNPAASFVNGATVSYIVQGYGYYAITKIVVTCTAASTFSLSYSGGQAAFNTLVGPPNGVPLSPGGNTGNVQGVVGGGQNASLVNPVVTSGLELPINGNFTSVGIDTFGNSAVTVPPGSSVTFTLGVAPTPQQSGELGVVFAGVVAGTSGALVSPWQSVAGAAGICSGGSPQFCMGFVSNIQPNQVLKQTYGNSGSGGNEISQFILLTGVNPSVRQSQIFSSSASGAFVSNTLAGSTLLFSLQCGGVVPCSVSGVTDTQGHTWQQLGGNTLNNGSGSSGVITWAATSPSTAAADTITAVLSNGTVSASIAAEITGISPSSLTTPTIPLAVNPLGQQVITLDAQAPNQFNCSVTLSTNTTTQCQPAPTVINGVPVRLYVTDFQINTTTAGTATTITLKTGTGTNCATGTANLSTINYADTVVGLQSILGMRTPLISPLQSAVCATQAGTTPGTVTIEIHGFLAP